MSRARWALAAGVLIGLGLLVAWQQHRWHLVAGCADRGGVWDGRRGLCLPPLPGPILKRDLERT